MGEYIQIIGDPDIIKIGTCEDCYYIRLEQLREIVSRGQAEKVPGNLPPAEYLTPEKWRYRFPFPDEDQVRPGGFTPYNRGAVVILTQETAPKLLELLRGPEWEHDKLCHWTRNLNIMGIPCPNSQDMKTSGLSIGGSVLDDVELVQQKLMSSGEVWPVIRCPYCGSAIRLNPELGAELAAAAELQPDEFYQELARRVSAGYQVKK